MCSSFKIFHPKIQIFVKQAFFHVWHISKSFLSAANENKAKNRIIHGWSFNFFKLSWLSFFLRKALGDHICKKAKRTGHLHKRSYSPPQKRRKRELGGFFTDFFRFPALYALVRALSSWQCLTSGRGGTFFSHVCDLSRYLHFHVWHRGFQRTTSGCFWRS